MTALRPFSLLLLVLLAACSALELPEKESRPGAVDFSQPQTDQLSRYRIYSTTCNKLDEDFEWTGDTLLLWWEQQDDRWYLAEALSQGSPNKGWQLDTFRQEVRFHADYCLLPQRFGSRLFGFYGNDTLWLQKPIDARVKQNDCRIDIGGEQFIGEELGLLPDFRIGEVEVKEVMAVSCVPNMFSVSGYLLYDSRYLQVSHWVAEDLAGSETVNGLFLMK